MIGIQYGITALLFLFFGFLPDAGMRWQIGASRPGRPVRRQLLGRRFGNARTQAAGGMMLRELYNALGAMHGTIMVFLGDRAARVRRLRQLRDAAADRRAGHGVPALNMASYWTLFRRRRGDARELLRPRRRGAVRLDLLSAARHHRPTANGQTWWLIGMVFLITSSLLGAVNFIATIIQLARQGPDLDAPAVLRLGAVRDRLPAAAGLPAARGRRRHAADGPGCRHELLPADRSRRQRQAG